MTAAGVCENRVAPNITIRVAPNAVVEIEAFAVFAYGEIEAVRQGGDLPDGRHMCEFPDCANLFLPRLPGQLYCSPACKTCDTAEKRTIGLKAGPALLAHRANKYAAKGSAEADLCRAARRFITRLQSEWLQSRKDRRAAAIDRLAKNV